LGTGAPESAANGSDGGGCSMTGAPGSSTGLLALCTALGAALGMARRRVRRAAR
jgi:hypothetical protein